MIVYCNSANDWCYREDLLVIDDNTYRYSTQVTKCVNTTVYAVHWGDGVYEVESPCCYLLTAPYKCSAVKVIHHVWKWVTVGLGRDLVSLVSSYLRCNLTMSLCMLLWFNTTVWYGQEYWTPVSLHLAAASSGISWLVLKQFLVQCSLSAVIFISFCCLCCIVCVFFSLRQPDFCCLYIDRLWFQRPLRSMTQLQDRQDGVAFFANAQNMETTLSLCNCLKHIRNVPVSHPLTD